METLLEVDRQLFLFINHLPHNIFILTLMLFLSAIGGAGAVWFVLGLVLAYLAGKKNLKSVVNFLYPLILSLVLTHILVNLILKPLTLRMRPNFVIPQTLLVGPTFNDFSFPSGHSASSFASAYVLGERIRRRLAIPKISAVVDNFGMAKWLRLGLYLLAVLISFSRVYLGVHYPSDIFVGAVLGILVGKLAIFIDKRI